MDKVIEQLKDLAGQDMTEDNIDPDYWCDHEDEYIVGYIQELSELYEVE